MSGPRHVFAVSSAGRLLTVAADDRMAAWWPHLAPHVPGADSAGLAVLSAGGSSADLSLASRIGSGDARRLINVRLQRLHLGYDVLSLHAVALVRPGCGSSVVLLGGHGAGKTLVAIALAEAGWLPVSGDLALLNVGPQPAVLGGTSAFLARPKAVHRWFPGLHLPDTGADRVDLRGRWGSVAQLGPWPVRAAVLVDVDGDPAARLEQPKTVDAHTAVSAWLRASTHLLDRILDSSPEVLRLVEDEGSARRRVELVRHLAARLPLHTAWGAPQFIASRIDELVPAGDDVMEGAVG